MNLEDALLGPAPKPIKGHLDGVGELHLTASEEAAILTASESGWTWQDIANAINKSRGVKLRADTVSNHAQGRCQCVRP